MKARDHPKHQLATPLSTLILSENDTAARQRFQQLLEQEHPLGNRRPKGRSLYQVICRGDQWLGLMLWTGSCWHRKARDQWIGWDAVTRSERLPLIVQQGRFLVLEQSREPNLASQMLGIGVRELPAQWEQALGYRPLLAETFTDPESHAGTCYKAAGWQAVGMSGRDGRHCADKYPEQARPKKLWLKALAAEAREQLCARQLPKALQAGLADHAAERSALKSPQFESLFQTFPKVPDPRARSPLTKRPARKNKPTATS